MSIITTVIYVVVGALICLVGLLGCFIFIDRYGDTIFFWLRRRDLEVVAIKADQLQSENKPEVSDPQLCRCQDQEIPTPRAAGVRQTSQSATTDTDDQMQVSDSLPMIELAQSPYGEQQVYSLMVGNNPR